MDDPQGLERAEWEGGRCRAELCRLSRPTCFLEDCETSLHVRLHRRNYDNYHYRDSRSFGLQQIDGNTKRGKIHKVRFYRQPIELMTRFMSLLCWAPVNQCPNKSDGAQRPLCWQVKEVYTMDSAYTPVISHNDILQDRQATSRATHS